MDTQSFDLGKQAYAQGDFLAAVAALESAKEPGEIAGEADHLLGNAYMRLGQFDKAAASYESALRDVAYGKRGAISCNQGRALLAAGRPQDALVPLNMAVRDEFYDSQYKAFMALGSAYEQLGDVKNAGVAYRKAAIDKANPQPAKALRLLGMCFIKLSRPADAVEAYRTALDYTTPLESQNLIYQDLGLAYVAANRMPEAVDAFTHATQDGTFTLIPEAQAAFDAAKKALAAIQAKQGPSETDEFLQATGYDNYDPLDPTGASGELMPSPDDTGFWSVQEEELIDADKSNRKVKRKHRHRGLKIFLGFLIVILLCVSASFIAYWQGFGYPTQETVVSQLFDVRSNSGDVSALLAPSAQISASDVQTLLPQYASVKVSGVDRSMNESKVYAIATLSGGGEQDYVIDLARSGIGWKVANITAEYPSQSK